MARRKHGVSSRDRGYQLLRWLLLMVAGLGGGWLLGEMAAENLHGVTADGATSYSGFSANPDASSALASLPQDAGLDCPDSYGVAVRMRAAHEPRMNDAFRELGAVDAERTPADEPADEYHYGGRFPDTKPGPAEIVVRDATAPLSGDPQP